MPQVPANLLVPCDPLPLLSDGIAASVLRWSIEVVNQYQDCAASHQALIQAISPGRSAP